MSKAGEILKSNLYGIIGMVIIAGATWAGNVFMKGKDANDKEAVLSIMRSDAGVAIMDSVFELKAHEKTTDFEMFDKILSSPFIGEYAKEFEDRIIADYDRRDSLRGNWMEQVGAGTGDRNENVIPELIKMLNDWKAGKLNNSRNVRATF